MALTKKRMILSLFVGLSGFVLLFLFIFDGDVVVKGIVHGETFYRGLPKKSARASCISAGAGNSGMRKILHFITAALHGRSVI